MNIPYKLNRTGKVAWQSDPFKLSHWDDGRWSRPTHAVLCEAFQKDDGGGGDDNVVVIFLYSFVCVGHNYICSILFVLPFILILQSLTTIIMIKDLIVSFEEFT